ELGLHRDHQLANVIDPGVDIFFSAHTHELTPAPLSSKSGAIVVEAGNDAYLGNMVVTLSDGVASDFSWEVLAVDESLEQDPEMLLLVTQARAPFLGEGVNFKYPMPGMEWPLTEAIDSASGHVAVDLHRRNVLENPFNNLLADSMRSYYHTDIALTPGFRFDTVIPANTEITLEQLYRYLPVPPELSKGTVSGKNLKLVFETELARVFSTDAFEHSGGWLMGVSGIDLTLDLSRDKGKRVLAMARSGDMSEILPDDILTVVSCTRPFDDDDVMCSNPGFASVEKLPGPDGEHWTPMALLRHTLQNDLPDNRTQLHFHDNSLTPAWPKSPYLQPLHSQGLH
ncbi:MAG: 5'-nucleotidase C-terminal domain-containing protein, partial [Proteobacteria bacterium]|nr:5'-nucleotidase C-terminal domain-containing protein [Pseudomonadota bacterium]